MTAAADIVVPYDPEAERGLIGALLTGYVSIGEALDLVRPTDFYGPGHAGVVAVLEDLYRDGRKWDDYSVRDECKRRSVPFTAADIISCMAAGRLGTWRRIAEQLVELRARRDLLSVASELTTHATNPAVHPSEAVTAATARLADMTTTVDDVPGELMSSDALCDAPIDPADWVVPDLLARGHRAVLVGFEGHGKSLALSQIGWCAAQGLHPFTHRACRPVNVLHIDLENPPDRIQAGYRPLRDLCRQQSKTFDAARHVTWHRNDGIDIRARRDRAQLDAICRRYRPDLVCLGPLRKAYRHGPAENDERAALSVQSVLDDLRVRFGFALLIEHHAPHSDGSTGGRRPRPMGSSTWLGWSEFGFGMAPIKGQEGRYYLERWRLDRVTAHWPDELHRGSTCSSPWYWEGKWNAGMREEF